MNAVASAAHGFYSLLASDKWFIQIVVWFYVWTLQRLAWTENQESIFFSCAAESNVCTSPRRREIDFSERLEHKQDVDALPHALLRRDMHNIIPAMLSITAAMTSA